MTNKEAIKRRYTFGNDEFNLEAAYHDCKLVFDGITDDDLFQEADTGLILYYANEIIYALHEALEGKNLDVPSIDTISRRAAINAVEESRRLNHHKDGKAARAHEYEHIHFLKLLTYLSPEQPSRIEQALHGKAPEEQYKILYWLMFEYANTFNDARRAVIDWLGEQDENGRKDIPLDTDDVFDAELAKRILNNK